MFNLIFCSLFAIVTVLAFGSPNSPLLRILTGPKWVLIGVFFLIVAAIIRRAVFKTHLAKVINDFGWSFTVFFLLLWILIFIHVGPQPRVGFVTPSFPC